MSTDAEITPAAPGGASGEILDDRFVDLIARKLQCRSPQVVAAARLFAEGATVPFVARYRKEATGGLLDEQLELIAKERDYFLDLASRREGILKSLEEQGKLTPELAASLRAVTTKQELEDLYLPYKKKRRTRAQIAREKGLEPLADGLVREAPGRRDPRELAREFVNPDLGVEDVDGALSSARDILAERVAELAANRAFVRELLAREGVLHVRVAKGKEEEGRVYQDYYDYRESVQRIRSHRLLAILRGERDGFLSTDLSGDDDRCVERLARGWRAPLQTPCGEQLLLATQDGYRRLLKPSLQNEVRAEAKERAEREAMEVFRDNLEALLMQSPLGQVPVMGLDPGYRTGCKMAVVDRTGRVLDSGVIHAIPPGAKEREAASTIVRLAKAHDVHAIAVGNGTGSRETEAFARATVKEAGLSSVIVAIVPETGASVYSSSAVAREELPDYDVSIRGAVSIARRLQDPLAELVKIEPRSLGVGQYQHDVNQKALSQELDLAVERIVNRVGVELNTASAPLLRRVSGLSERLARNVVEHRDEQGPFGRRRDLLKVGGFGKKTFELAAGFLRIREGTTLLDRTAVHPERYGLVEEMCRELKVPLEKILGNPELVGRVDFDRYLDEEKGLGQFTLEDIRLELERPGRDPRPEFESPEWREDVQSMDDVQEGMVLEGRVSNVTNFGAFVDVGIKRDGLVHISELCDRWVEDPREVVSVGQIVRVKVLEIDRERGRVGLSIKALEKN